MMREEGSQVAGDLLHLCPADRISGYHSLPQVPGGGEVTGTVHSNSPMETEDSLLEGEKHTCGLSSHTDSGRWIQILT